MMDTIFSLHTLWWILLGLYVPSCLFLVVIVLLQKGKGVGFAGAFGAGGGSDAVFGPRSSKSLPQRITYSTAGLFMLLALLMSMLSGRLGNNSAPALVDDAGMSATEGTSVPAGSLGALFIDGTAAPKEDVAPLISVDAPVIVEESAPAETPAVDGAVETPMPEATPEEAAPVEEATPAPAEAVAPAEAAAPAAETPAAQ